MGDGCSLLHVTLLCCVANTSLSKRVMLGMTAPCTVMPHRDVATSNALHTVHDSAHIYESATLMQHPAVAVALHAMQLRGACRA